MDTLEDNAGKTAPAAGRTDESTTVTPEEALRVVRENPMPGDAEAPSPAGLAPSDETPASTESAPYAAEDLRGEPSSASTCGGRSVVGLDVGSRTLKLVHLQTSGSGIRLVDAFVTELPPTSDPGRFGVVSRCVEKFLAGAEPRVKAACCALAREGAATVCCSMPKMGEKDLAQALRWKIAETGTVDADHATIGYYTLDPKNAAGNTDVVVAAAPPGIGKMDTLFPADNPRLTVVIPEPVALENIVTATYHAEGRGATAVLDVGTASSTLSVVGEHGLEFTRDIPVGGDTVTAALAGTVTLENGALEISRQAAEQLKKNYTIGDAGTIEATGVALPGNRILGAIRPVLERLASEVMRSLQFYAQSHSLARVESLYLCGGGAMLRGLADYFTKETRIPTSLLDPWRALGFEVSPGVQAAPALFAVATGTAIHDGARINLLPAHIKAKRVISAIRTASLFATALILFTLTGLSWTASRQKAAMNNVLALKREASAPMQTIAAKVAMAQKYKKELGRRREILKSLGVGQPIHAAILKELSNIMPEGSYLRSLSFAKKDGVRTIRLNVDIYSMPSASAVRLKQHLIAALEDSPFFVNVSFAPADGRTQQGLRPPDEALALTCQVLGFPGD